MSENRCNGNFRQLNNQIRRWLPETSMLLSNRNLLFWVMWLKTIFYVRHKNHSWEIIIKGYRIRKILPSHLKTQRLTKIKAWNKPTQTLIHEFSFALVLLHLFLFFNWILKVSYCRISNWWSIVLNSHE